jgi:hypothetical protein
MDSLAYVCFCTTSPHSLDSQRIYIAKLVAITPPQKTGSLAYVCHRTTSWHWVRIQRTIVAKLAAVKRSERWIVWRTFVSAQPDGTECMNSRHGYEACSLYAIQKPQSHRANPKCCTRVSGSGFGRLTLAVTRPPPTNLASKTAQPAARVDRLVSRNGPIRFGISTGRQSRL